MHFLLASLKYTILWVLVVPISFLIKKKNVVFIGRDDGRFTDNVKYLFVHALQDNYTPKKIAFITQNKEVYSKLDNHGLPVIYHPSIKSFYKLLTSKVAVMDSERWVDMGKYHLLFNSVRIQLWHAVPTKKIGLIKRLDNFHKGEYTIIKRILDVVKGNYCSYDAFISTSSQLIEANFRLSFKSKRYLNFGYPRNDVLFRSPSIIDRVGIDDGCAKTIDESIIKNMDVVLYAPTFRKKDQFLDDIINIHLLNDFCKDNSILFVIKMHYRPSTIRRANMSGIDNVVFYNNKSDMYPMLRKVSLLITDYSSIYIDFLFFEKPVAFFPYDLTEYYLGVIGDIEKYKNAVEGPIFMDQDSLMQGVKCMLEGKQYSDSNNELFSRSFDYKDGKSSSRIWSYICDEYGI